MDRRPIEVVGVFLQDHPTNVSSNLQRNLLLGSFRGIHGDRKSQDGISHLVSQEDLEELTQRVGQRILPQLVGANICLKGVNRLAGTLQVGTTIEVGGIPMEVLGEAQTVLPDHPMFTRYYRGSVEEFMQKASGLTGVYATNKAKGTIKPGMPVRID